jgi:hypothetical protein
MTHKDRQERVRDSLTKGVPLSLVPLNKASRVTLVTVEEKKPEGIGRLMNWCISHGGNPRWYDHPSRIYIDIDVSVKKNLYQQAHRYGVGLKEEIDLLVEREYLPIVHPECVALAAIAALDER